MSVGESQDMVFLTSLLDKGNTFGKKILPHSQIYYFFELMYIEVLLGKMKNAFIVVTYKYK